MKTNRNGYAMSIMQEDLTFCYHCGRRNRKLDRHEPFGGAYRDKSKRLGLEYFELEDCCKNAALQIKRPPQSWYYVEDGVFSA